MKLTNKQAREMRRRYAAGDSQTVLAEQYSVGQGTVSRIVRGIGYQAAGGPIADTSRETRDRFTADEVRELRDAYTRGTPATQLAEQAGISRISMHALLAARTYKDVPS